jgi:hypothetical protein
VSRRQNGGAGQESQPEKELAVGDRHFRFEIGPYWLSLPADARISAEVTEPGPGTAQMAFTTWIVSLGRFQLFINLSAVHDLTDLKVFIDSTTKSNVVTPSIVVNGIPGVTHGGYGPARTWIDWWFKKGDTTICLCLQSKMFPVTEPTQAEIAEHDAVVRSLKYCRDFPGEKPPGPA